MRTATVSALVVLLSLIWFPSPAAAQSSAGGPLSHLSLLPDPPSGAQAPGLPKGEPERASVFKGLPSNQTNAPRELNERSTQLNPFPDGHWKDRGRYLYGVQPRADARSCAHILIRRLPSADSKMIRKMAGGSESGPTVKGVPVCREDIR